uniref:Uncharacterized protein n=1 Tax=Davidia involucrata TaxID=16924 RepID=A0A5B7A007_DAVIN
MERTMELSILCDIKACGVCFGPNREVETWPERASDVKAILDMWKEKSNQGHDKVQSPVDVKIKAISKWEEKWLDGLSMKESIGLVECLNSKLEAITNIVEFLKATTEKENGKGKETAVIHEDFGATNNQSSDILKEPRLGMVRDLYQPLQTNTGQNNFDDSPVPVQVFVLGWIYLLEDVQKCCQLVNKYTSLILG